MSVGCSEYFLRNNSRTLLCCFTGPSLHVLALYFVMTVLSRVRVFSSTIRLSCSVGVLSVVMVSSMDAQLVFCFFLLFRITTSSAVYLGANYGALSTFFVSALEFARFLFRPCGDCYIM